jgi:hypothetical protein
MRKEQLASSALVLIGADPIDDFNGDTDEARVASTLYENSRNSLLQGTPWHFSKKQQQLSRLSNTPLFGYQYAFELPPDCGRFLGVKGRYDYEILGSQVHCNQSEVYALYQARVVEGFFDEAAFPAYFNQALIYYLASQFALSIPGSNSDGQLFYRFYENELQKARNIDAQQTPPQGLPLSSFALIGARY